jgi:UDP-3-O-acyl-N-acetylglucosamine deacetylase
MDRIRRHLNVISPAMEFAIVILVAFGYPVIGNAIETFSDKTANVGFGEHCSEARTTGIGCRHSIALSPWNESDAT